MSDDAANYLSALNRRMTRLAGAAMILVVIGLILFKVAGAGSGSVVAACLWLLGIASAASSVYGRTLLHKGVVLGSGPSGPLEVRRSSAAGRFATSGRASLYDGGKPGGAPIAEVRCAWLARGVGEQPDGVVEFYGLAEPGQMVMAVNGTGGMIGRARA